MEPPVVQGMDISGGKENDDQQTCINVIECCSCCCHCCAATTAACLVPTLDDRNVSAVLGLPLMQVREMEAPPVQGMEISGEDDQQNKSINCCCSDCCYCACCDELPTVTSMACCGLA